MNIFHIIRWKKSNKKIDILSAINDKTTNIFTEYRWGRKKEKYATLANPWGSWNFDNKKQI